MILGIDISTSVIGYTIINDRGKLEKIGYLNIGALGDLFDKARFIKNEFSNMLSKYKITHIFIEDISKKFSKGFSSAQIITLLAKFNGIVSNILFEITNVKPTYLMPSSARKTAYNRSFQKGIDIKKEVFNEVMKLEKLSWPTNEKGSLIKCAFDACDSYTLALAGYKISHGFK
jgi:Holliday junction resolvasome RuvABC endonuclease subunit